MGESSKSLQALQTHLEWWLIPWAPSELGLVAIIDYPVANDLLQLRDFTQFKVGKNQTCKTLHATTTMLHAPKMKKVSHVQTIPMIHVLWWIVISITCTMALAQAKHVVRIAQPCTRLPGCVLRSTCLAAEMRYCSSRLAEVGLGDCWWWWPTGERLVNRSVIAMANND